MWYLHHEERTFRVNTLQDNIGQINAESTRYDECTVPKMHGDTVRDPIVPGQNDGRLGNDGGIHVVDISYDAIRYDIKAWTLWTCDCLAQVTGNPARRVNRRITFSPPVARVASLTRPETCLTAAEWPEARGRSDKRTVTCDSDRLGAHKSHRR